MSKLQLGMTYEDTVVPFPTSLEDRLRLHHFALEMLRADVDPEFVDRSIEYARQCNGMYKLIEIWSELPSDSEEESDILAQMRNFLEG